MSRFRGASLSLLNESYANVGKLTAHVAGTTKVNELVTVTATGNADSHSSWQEVPGDVETSSVRVYRTLPGPSQ